MKIALTLAALSGLSLGFLSRTAPEFETPQSSSPSNPLSSLKAQSTISEPQTLSSDTLNKISLLQKIPTLAATEIQALWNQGQNDYRIRQLLLDRWVQLDPQGAIDHAKKTNDSRFAWISWGKHDAQSALEYADQVSRENRLWIIKGVAETDHRHAIALIEANGGYNGGLCPPVVTSAIIEGLAKVDHQDALNFYAAHHGSFYDPNPMIKWSLAEPTRALPWLAQNHQIFGSPIFAKKTAARIAETNPEAFAQALKQIPTGLIKNYYLEAQQEAQARK